ncbi:MAG: hypothetical protein OEL20_13880 [Sulfuritalea sp.]|nr:hypothetical protein [Sulfuritalea sp.]
MIKMLLVEEIRLLTFRPVSAAIHVHWRAFLAFGLLFTWLAGIGRYWDNPKAHLWQYLGLGSIAYVFVLALIVWGLLAPLRPKNWSYRNILLFITLTSPPALFYAIPVEQFMAANAARTANAWFLIVVATWRVALFFVFLRRAAGLSAGTVVVATLLPLVIIIITLFALNLEHVVFSLMSGIREEDRSPNDGAYGVVFLLSMLSFAAAPFLGIGYIVAIIRAWTKARPVNPPDAPLRLP